MAVTVAASKTVSFRSPYTGATFQDLTAHIMGRDGYISGGETSDDGVTVEVEPTVIVQRGIVATSQVAATGIDVPTAVEPWFLLAAVPDDDPDSGISFSVTADPGAAAAAVVVAFKANGAWRNTLPVDVAAAARSVVESGVEVGGGTREIMDAAGVVTAVTAFRSSLVAPDGQRVDLPRTGANSAKAFNLAPFQPNQIANRNDYVVLRQGEGPTAEVVYAMGSVETPVTAAAAVSLASGAGVAGPSYFGRRGGTIGQQWWTWGDGFDLKIQAGPAGEGYSPVTLATGGTISTTFVAGQRASDDAVLVLYVDGVNLRLVAAKPANPSGGSQLSAPATLESLTGQISNIRAVLDRNGLLHIVFEHDEALQQVYYMSCQTVAGAGFGLVATAAHRIAIGGAFTGNNDTSPSIGVNRRGEVTVAYIRNAGAFTYGDMVVAAISPSGTTISEQTIFAAAGAGVDASISTGLNNGAAATAMTNLRSPAVVVTPHDELSIYVLGLSTGANVDYVLVHQPGADVGFDLINPLPRSALVATHSMTALAAVAGELGEVHLAFKLLGAANAVQYQQATVDPGDVRLGRTSTALLLDPVTFASGTDASGYTDLRLARGPLGEVVASYMFGTVATGSRLPGVGYARPLAHPKDVYLGGWTVPTGVGLTVSGRAREFEVFSTRPKKMNYPFLVGNEGDYQGYGSIYAAVEKANRLGGEVVVRPGQYQLPRELHLYGGVRLIGEGSAALLLAGTTATHGLVLGNDWSYSAYAITVSGNIVSSADAQLTKLKPGDRIDVGTSGKHTVLRALGYDTTSATYKVLVESNAVGAPATAGFATGQFAGIAVENFSILLPSGTTFNAVDVTLCKGARLSNLRFEGDAVVGGLGYAIVVSVAGSDDTVIDGMDFTQTTLGPADAAIFVASAENLAIRRARFADGKGMIKLFQNATNVHLSDCHGDGTDATKTLYDLVNTRTTPLFVSNCEGRFAGDAASLALVRTEVGQRLRAPEALGALVFEDDNTRASTISDDGIKLSSATHKEFDGVSKDVITDAVNERVLRAGDTMTGALTMGANILTNGTTRALGATGAAANRYDAFLNAVNALGLITAQTGLTASANQHVSISGTARYKHGSITTSLPIAAGNVAGGTPTFVDSSRWSGSFIVNLPIVLPANKRLVSLKLHCNRGGAGTISLSLDQSVAGAAPGNVTTASLAAGTGWVTLDMLAINYTFPASVSLVLTIITNNAANIVSYTEVEHDDL